MQIGYVNPLNTTLEFDVTLFGHQSATAQTVRFQNNIQSIFSRVRLLYGATPLVFLFHKNGTNLFQIRKTLLITMSLFVH